ncbi:hypothetical protein HY385_03220 [Candidatus Daviesbacteria bacterium]|nr:hypothetical protein [Candidatus Daviesbacteria bacterium]
MLQETEQKIFRLNRAQRRRRINQSKFQPAYQPILDQLNEVGADYNQVCIRRNEILVGKKAMSGIASVYQIDSGNILMEFVDRMRSVSMLRRQVGKWHECRPMIADPKHDPYFHSIGGISLATIEQMPLPLSLEDIARITGFLRSHPLLKWTLSNSAKVAQETAVVLPSLNLANPEVTVPDQIKPLNDRLKDYFGYWASFLIRSDVDQQQEDRFFRALLPSGPRIFEGLANFIPARLGITPNSATKLMNERVSPFLQSLGYAQISRHIGGIMKEAYRRGSLPPELEKFQHYDPKADKEIMDVLQNYSQQEALEQPVDYLARLHEYRKPLRAAILGSKEHFLTLPLEHTQIDSVILAAQPQYKNSLIFVAHLRGTELNLVLEANGNNRLYGIQPALLRENPHIGSNLVHDVLEPVVAYAEARFPELKPRPVVKPLLPRVIASLNTGDTSRPPELENIVADDRVVKRKRLPHPKTDESNLPERLEVEEIKPVLYVDHTRSKVEKLMGKNIRPEDVDQIMKAIHRLEMGSAVDIKKLTDIPDHVRLRVGGWRLIFSNLDHTYNLVEILRRDDHTSHQLMRQFN